MQIVCVPACTTTPTFFINSGVLEIIDLFDTHTPANTAVDIKITGWVNPATAEMFPFALWTVFCDETTDYSTYAIDSAIAILEMKSEVQLLVVSNS